MGLFWPRRAIDARSRRLLGSKTRGGRAGIVNFWDQQGIYALYRDFDLVYVGQTAGGGLGTRLVQHSKHDIAERWDRFSWFGLGLVTRTGELRSVPTRFHVDRAIVANHIEGVLIEVAEPRLNSQSGRWKKAVTLFHPLAAANGEKGQGTPESSEEE